MIQLKLERRNVPSFPECACLTGMERQGCRGRCRVCFTLEKSRNLQAGQRWGSELSEQRCRRRRGWLLLP